MKNLIWIVAAMCVLAACSKEEPAATVADEPAAIEPAATDTATTADETAEAQGETLEVVEESAAEAEPEGETIVLAMAETESPVAPRQWQFQEGKNYVRMIPTQPTVGGADKIEVAEFFWYGCPHCYDMEPYINRWAENKNPGVRFVRVPAVWNPLVRLHAQLYYTEEVLVRNGTIKDAAGFRETVFQEYHQRGNRMTSPAAIAKIFARFGVSQEEFDRTWNSFEVNQKLRVAEDLARRYTIASVPAIVVNGKYRTSAGEAGGYPKLMELIDELTVREGLN